MKRVILNLNDTDIISFDDAIAKKRYFGAIHSNSKVMLVQTMNFNKKQWCWVTKNLAFFAVGNYDDMIEAIKCPNFKAIYHFDDLVALADWMESYDT